MGRSPNLGMERSRAAAGWLAVLLCSLASAEAWSSSELIHAMDPVLQAEHAAIEEAKQQVAANAEVTAKHHAKLVELQQAKAEKATEKLAERHRKSAELRAEKARAKARTLQRFGAETME